MPDITTLLDDLTSGPRRPDPVQLVRARVRRRARRRAVAGTVTAVIAGALCFRVAGFEQRIFTPVLSGTASASATPAPPTMTWAALGTLTREHPEAFVGFHVAVGDQGQDSPVGVVAFGPGVDQRVWDQRLRAAADGAPYQTKQCGYSFAELAAVNASVDGYTLPSGHTHGGDISSLHCAVTVTGPHLDDADAAELRDRFGDAIVVVPW